MDRKLRPTKSTYQIKEGQVNLLLEDAETNLEEYKKVVELRATNLLKQKRYLKGQNVVTIH